MAEARVTTDHEKIRSWVEARGGRPKRVKGRGLNDASGSVRIAYPGVRSDEPLESIAWTDWFRAFDDNRLAFLYEDSLGSGNSKLVSRAKVATPRRAGAAKRTTSKRAASKRGAAKVKAKIKVKGRASKLTPIVAVAETSTSKRKAPRAMAARIGKRPTSAKKRSSAKKRAAGAKRAGAKRAGAKRAGAKRAGAKG